MIDGEKRPWGHFDILADKENYKVKEIVVLPGQRLSYQYHHKRSEIWVVIKGVASVLLDDKENIVQKGDYIFIPQGAKHRVMNSQKEDLVFVEVQVGTYFGEDDIVRLEDDYNRK